MEKGHQLIGLHAILAAMNGISVERFHDHMTRPNNISNLDSLFHCYIVGYFCFKEQSINHYGSVVR